LRRQTCRPSLFSTCMHAYIDGTNLLLFLYVGVYEATLEPGDTIYIPTGSAYATQNLAAPTISVVSGFLDYEHADQVEDLFCRRFETSHLKNPVCLQVTHAVDELPITSSVELGARKALLSASWWASEALACPKFGHELGYPGSNDTCPGLKKICKSGFEKSKRVLARERRLFGRLALAKDLVDLEHLKSFDDVSKAVYNDAIPYQLLDSLVLPGESKYLYNYFEPEDTDNQVQLELLNQCGEDLRFFWVEQLGHNAEQEHFLGIRSNGGTYSDGTYEEHTYRVKTSSGQAFDYRVQGLRGKEFHVFICHNHQGVNQGNDGEL